MVEFFRRQTPEKIQERRQEVAVELNDPQMDEMSTRLFEGRIRQVQMRLDMDGWEGGEQEYARLQEQEKHLLAEHDKDLFLYTARKASEYHGKKLFWIYQHHWEDIFLKPEYLGTLGGELDEGERRFVTGRISEELRTNLKEAKKARYLETLRAIENAKSNLEAFLVSFRPHKPQSGKTHRERISRHCAVVHAPG